MTGLPELVTPPGRWARLRYRSCPDCGDRFPNGRWQASVYPMHYAAAHLGISPFCVPGRTR
jgi:hypothetical protein